ncbi:hypothetical protein PV-S19_0085 [Pacmanvirus S19]|nr:hypothetical protein PV-S19_0085 [Pacmanvirus S19]
MFTTHKTILDKVVPIEITDIYTLDDLISEYKEFTSKQEKPYFPINKLVMHRELYKNNGKYRRFMNSKIPAGLLENDPTINEKTTMQQKLVAEATFTWNYDRSHGLKQLDNLDKLYIECRKLYGSN